MATYFFVFSDKEVGKKTPPDSPALRVPSSFLIVSAAAGLLAAKSARQTSSQTASSTFTHSSACSRGDQKIVHSKFSQ